MEKGQLLIVAFSLFASAWAGRSRLETANCAFTEVPDETSGALSYYVPETSPGNPNCSDSTISPRCIQQVQNHLLSGRSWFLTQEKKYFGRSYNEWWFEIYNIRCPVGHYLFLKLQDLRLECVAGIEGMTIITEELGSSLFCTPAQFEGTPYYNDGRGVYIAEGSARVEFCSDSGDEKNYGFALRATCFQPSLGDSPGCVSYRFFRDWDPLFTNLLLDPFDKIELTVVPHKRSAEEKAQQMETFQSFREQKIQEAEAEKKTFLSMTNTIERQKRQQNRVFFYYPNGTTVTYINSILKFNFPNGTTKEERVSCLSAGNSVFGARYYTVNATRQSGDMTGTTNIVFTGPGFVDIYRTGGRAVGKLNWTPSQKSNEIYKQDTEQLERANDIYDYIYENWLAPYPVIDDLEDIVGTRKTFPLFGADGKFATTIRRTTQVNAVFPEIMEESKCRYATRLNAAPLVGSTIDSNLTAVCNFYQHACNPVLATACRELLLLDPYNMNMMGGGGDR